jgi:peptide/nickel transport system ATP-binding protein
VSLLELRGLTVALGTGRPIVDDLDLTVERGEVVGLVGKSGCGKSTTAGCTLGIWPPHATVSGRVVVHGDDVLAMSPTELRTLRTSRVAMIYQQPRSSFNPVRPVGDFLTEQLVTNLGWSRPQADARILELVAAVGLTDPERRLTEYPHQFSGGMLQRLVIAAALATDPDLLLADEATSALDVTTQAEVLGILRRLQRERALGILLITHDLPLAAAFCDRVAVMHEGTKVEEQQAADLFANPTHPATKELLAAAPELFPEVDHDPGTPLTPGGAP